MPDLPFATIGFDLDGTLLETHRDLGAAVNHALALGGFEPVPADHASDLIGGGAKIMLQRAVDEQGGLPEEEFRKLYKAMLAYYSENNAVHTRPYPHAREVLDQLRDSGIAMAVVTNKFESFARQILTTLDLADRFVAIIGGDTMGKGKANVDHWVAVVKPGRVLFELSYHDAVVAREALDRAIQKLPIKARFIVREEGF